MASIDARSSVRCCNFNYSGNQAAYSTDKAMGHNCELFVTDVRTMDSSVLDNPILRLPMNSSKITSQLWSMDELIITGHEDGHISSWDLRVRNCNFSSLNSFVFMKICFRWEKN